MSKMQKIVILIIAWFVLFEFNPSKDGGGIFGPKVNVGDFISDFEAMSYSGLFHMMNNAGASEPDIIDDTKDCKCNGSAKVSYDGGTSWTDCPCKVSGGKCNCSKPKSEEPLKQEEKVEQNSGPSKNLIDDRKWFAENYKILKITGDFCPPCKEWNAVQKPRFENYGFNVEEVDLKDNDKLADAIGLSSIPHFLICTKADGFYHAKRSGGFYEFVGKEFSVEDALGAIKKLDKDLHPSRQDGFFYKRMQDKQTQLNNKYWATKNEYISHLRNSDNHTAVRNWPLEKLSIYELKAIHDDSHEGKLGPINEL